MTISACRNHRRSQRRGDHVAQIVEDAANEAFVSGHERPYTNDPDPFDYLRLPQAVAIASERPSMREVRDAGYDRHPMTCPHPFAAVLERPACRRIHFGREVVGEEKDVQNGPPGVAVLASGVGPLLSGPFVPTKGHFAPSTGKRHDKTPIRHRRPEFGMPGRRLQPRTRPGGEGDRAARAQPSAALSVGTQPNLDRRMEMKSCDGRMGAASHLVDHPHACRTHGPASPMDRMAEQAPIAIMAAGDGHSAIALLDLQAERTRSPRDAKSRPDFRRIPPCHRDRVVRGRPTLAKALGPRAVERCSGIDEQAFTGNRQFEAQRVGMGVARQIIGTDRCDVEQRNRHANLQADIAALRQIRQPFRRRLRMRKPRGRSRRLPIASPSQRCRSRHR